VITTGDPADTGAFTISSSVLAHTLSGSAHYIVDWGYPYIWEIDGYDFVVWGADWDFAWRVWGSDQTSGRCLRLSHTDRYGQWAYAFSEFEWSVPDQGQRTETQWTWHAGTDLRVSIYPTAGPADGWQSVEITDFWDEDFVRIKVDGDLIFEESYERIGFVGYPGVGCGDVPAGAPSFGYLVLWWPDPVEPTTWGAVKALYR
jgi:hypothetical protein